MKTAILVTGKKFIGKGFRAIEPVIEELIESAKSEIHLTAYLFTKSALPILKKVEEALRRGVKVTMVFNDVNSQPLEVVQWFDERCKKYPHLKIRGFEDLDKGQLHAKVLIVDRSRALIGSANFTWRGMFSNHEVAVLLKGDDVWSLASLIDSL